MDSGFRTDFDIGRRNEEVPTENIHMDNLLLSGIQQLIKAEITASEQRIMSFLNEKFMDLKEHHKEQESNTIETLTTNFQSVMKGQEEIIAVTGGKRGGAELDSGRVKRRRLGSKPRKATEQSRDLCDRLGVHQMQVFQDKIEESVRESIYIENGPTYVDVHTFLAHVQATTPHSELALPINREEMSHFCEQHKQAIKKKWSDVRAQFSTSIKTEMAKHEAYVSWRESDNYLKSPLNLSLDLVDSITQRVFKDGSLLHLAFTDIVLRRFLAGEKLHSRMSFTPHDREQMGLDEDRPYDALDLLKLQINRYAALVAEPKPVVPSSTATANTAPPIVVPVVPIEHV